MELHRDQAVADARDDSRNTGVRDLRVVCRSCVLRCIVLSRRRCCCSPFCCRRMAAPVSVFSPSVDQCASFEECVHARRVDDARAALSKLAEAQGCSVSQIKLPIVTMCSLLMETNGATLRTLIAAGYVFSEHDVNFALGLVFNNGVGLAVRHTPQAHAAMIVTTRVCR